MSGSASTTVAPEDLYVPLTRDEREWKRLVEQKGVANDKRVYVNHLYLVAVVERPEGWTSVSVARHDKEPVRSWRHLQRIKNEICGNEREAIELFPAESRLLDVNNTYHLIVAPLGWRFPLGDDMGRLVSKGPGGSWTKA